MKILTPLMSEDARGAFGPGAVFGKWRATNWVRERVMNPLRRSSREVAARNNLAMGAIAWGSLTGEQRQGWRDYAETITRYDVFGNPYNATGQCEFICNYCITREVGTAAPTAAPEVENPGYVEGLGLAMGLPNWDVIVVFTPNQYIEWVEIFLTAIKPGSFMSPVSNLSVIHGIKSTEFKSWHGPFTGDGYKRQWKVRGLMDSGQWGPWVQGIVPPTYP